MDSKEGIHWESALIKLAIIGLLLVILPAWWDHYLDEDGFTKFALRGIHHNMTTWLVEHTPGKE